MKKRQNSFYFLALTALAGLVFISSIRADTIYVSNESNNTIDKIVTFQNSATVTLFANTGLNKPLALALDNSGNLYAANLEIPPMVASRNSTPAETLAYSRPPPALRSAWRSDPITTSTPAFSRQI